MSSLSADLGGTHANRRGSEALQELSGGDQDVSIVPPVHHGTEKAGFIEPLLRTWFFCVRMRIYYSSPLVSENLEDSVTAVDQQCKKDRYVYVVSHIIPL